VLAEHAVGGFFGEIAALDWGAGFGYARQATVVAIEPLRLLVLSPTHLSRLMAISPTVDAVVRQAAQERLATVAD
jgi:CRP-like cAMP-binding protein